MLKLFPNISNLFKSSSRKFGQLLKYSNAKAWQAHSYGDISELQLNSIRVPHIENPRQVVIKVEAASINPIDLLMLGGYGRTLFQVPRLCEMELPLTLGRDFCGTVIYKGVEVDSSYKIGDKVYGFIPLHKQGSFAEIVVADSDHIVKKPENLSAVETASLVYASMTAWCALFIVGKLENQNLKGMKVLILGGSGGVGTAAIQILKSQGCAVYSTCATDAVPLLESLGATTFDYKQDKYLDDIACEGSYNIILDCAKFGPENIPTNIKYDSYIVLNAPLIKNTDQFGLIGGLAASAKDLLQMNLKPLTEKKTVKWAFFLPIPKGLAFLNSLIIENKIKPVIHKEFNFNELPQAFEEVSKGHLRGKVAVNFVKQ